MPTYGLRPIGEYLPAILATIMGNEMKPYTGIVEDQRIEVAGFAGVRKTEDTLELAFTNEDADAGRTAVRLPFFRLELTLGSDLAHWLAIALPELSDESGDVIKATDLVYAYLDGGRFVLLFVEGDEETVAVALPKGEAKQALGDRLCARILERGDEVRRTLMQRYNDSLSASA